MSDASLYAADSEVGAANAVSRNRADKRASRVFVHANLIFCLFLQRFCLFVGAGVVFWCLPLFLMTLAWLLLTGRARFRVFSLWSLGIFAAIALLSTLLAVDTVDTRIDGLSLPSLALVMITYLGLVVAPSPQFDGKPTFEIFVLYARALAICGILQYLAQFSGVRLFAFMEMVPALRPVLAEPYFNYHPVVSYGSQVLRSNGFFLLEPSIFSQILMLAVAVDVVVRKSWLFFPLYGVAYAVTYSGTGLLALTIAGGLAVVLVPGSSPRLLLLAVAGVLVAAVAAAVFPNAVAGLAARTNELSYEGSSGYTRYLGQFRLLNAFTGDMRTLIGFGPGALERSSIRIAGSTNPALKVFFEYGVLGLAAFAAFIIGTLWRRDIALVSLFVLVNYQLGGGFLLFAPFLILGALLIVWSAPAGMRGATHDTGINDD